MFAFTKKERERERKKKENKESERERERERINCLVTSGIESGQEFSWVKALQI